MWKRNNDNNDLKEGRLNPVIVTLEAEKASLTLMNEMSKKKIDELNTLIKQISEQFVVVKRERDMLKARHECLIGINEELTENLEAVESRTRDNQVELFRKLEEASSQINKLQKTLYLRDSELAAARSANDGLKKKVIELENNPNDLLERLDDRDSEIHDLKEKIIRLEQVIDSCNSRIRRAFDHALELEKENAYYRRQDHHVQTAIKDLITKLQAEKK